ncbi:MAG: helix-turn-helix transcriptional regulator [Actinomycetota bacterium]
MSTPGYQQSLGRRIAAERRRRGLSQSQLATMIDRSVAWVSQVERGARTIDRMSVLEMLARALEVPLAELAAEAPLVAALTEEPAGAGGLRLVLSGVHSLRPIVSEDGPPDLAGLSAQADQAWELTHAGQYTELTDLLTGLVPELESAALSTSEDGQAEVFSLLTATYQACSAALARLGDTEAAWIAADRAIAAAGRTGSPQLVAAGAYRLVFVFIAARHYAQAQETAQTAADGIGPLAAGGDPEAMSLLGGLTLQRGFIAARLGDAAAAYAFLADARQVAGHLGEGRDDHFTEFGPANVGLHEIAIAVELGDAGRALQAHADTDTSGLSPERRGRTLLDVARAHAQRRQVSEAVAALLEAERITPQQVRSHGLARQIATDLLAMADPPDTELRELAARLTGREQRADD